MTIANPCIFAQLTSFFFAAMFFCISFIWSLDSWSSFLTFAPELLLSWMSILVMSAKNSVQHLVRSVAKHTQATQHRTDVFDALLVCVFSLLLVSLNFLLSFPFGLLQALRLICTAEHGCSMGLISFLLKTLRSTTSSCLCALSPRFFALPVQQPAISECRPGPQRPASVPDRKRLRQTGRLQIRSAKTCKGFVA